MFESRCGVLCKGCVRKAEVHCKGCLNMSAPFWGGVCAVKSCCEAKQLDHCGQCAQFPCDMLCNMGKDQGFDPLPKIQHCRQWKAEEKVQSNG